MQSQNRIFDDLVKMMNGVAGTMAGVGREAESSMREKMREWVGGMDFVARDEFDAVKAMADATGLPVTGPESRPLAASSRSTNSITATAALSP